MWTWCEQGRWGKERSGWERRFCQVGEKTSLSQLLLLGSLPALRIYLLYFNQPLEFSLFRARLHSLLPIRLSPCLICFPLHASPCPTLLTQEEGEEPERSGTLILVEGRATEGSSERFPGREVPEVNEVSECRRAGDSGLEVSEVSWAQNLRRP